MQLNGSLIAGRLKPFADSKNKAWIFFDRRTQEKLLLALLTRLLQASDDRARRRGGDVGIRRQYLHGKDGAVVGPYVGRALHPSPPRSKPPIPREA